MSTYTSSEFTHQNINQLASFLIPTMFKEQPNNIIDYIADKDKPMKMEIYGKTYDVKGSPFENIFLVLDDINADPEDTDTDNSYWGGKKDKLGENVSNLNEFLTQIYFVGELIDETSGNRTMFPNSQYWGMENLEKLYDYEQIVYVTIDWNSDYIMKTAEEVREYIDLGHNEEEGDVYEGDIELWKQALDENDYYFTYKGENYFVYNIESNEIITRDNDESLSEQIWENEGETKRELNVTIKQFYGKEKIDKFFDLPMDKKMKEISRNDNASAILRRYFRFNALIGNNEKIYSSKDREYDYESISKKPLTDNGRKLKNMLNEFIRYTITNQSSIKERFKMLHTDIKIDDKTTVSQTVGNFGKQFFDFIEYIVNPKEVNINLAIFTKRKDFKYNLAKIRIKGTDYEEENLNELKNIFNNYLKIVYKVLNDEKYIEMFEKSAYYNAETIKKIPTYQEAQERIKNIFNKVNIYEQIKNEILPAINKLDVDELLVSQKNKIINGLENIIKPFNMKLNSEERHNIIYIEIK